MLQIVFSDSECGTLVCSVRVLYASHFIIFIAVLYFTVIKIFLNCLDIFKRWSDWSYFRRGREGTHAGRKKPSYSPIQGPEGEREPPGTTCGRQSWSCAMPRDNRSPAVAKAHHKIRTGSKAHCCTKCAQPRHVFRPPKAALCPAGVVPKAYPAGHNRLGRNLGVGNRPPAKR